MTNSTALETCTRRVSQIYIGPLTLIMFYIVYLLKLAIQRIKRKAKFGFFDVVTILYFLGVFLRFLYHLVRLVTGEEYKTIFLAYLSGTVIIMCNCYLTYFSIKMSNYVWINMKDFTEDKSFWSLSEKTFKIIFFCFNLGFLTVGMWVGIQLTSGLSDEDKYNQVINQGIIANAFIILTAIFWCSLGIHYYRKFLQMLKDLNNKTENVFTMIKISKTFLYSSTLLIVFLCISIIFAFLGVILESDPLQCIQFFGVECSLIVMTTYGHMLFLTYKKEKNEKEVDK
ncbi:hypothetical protein M0813_18629 [Anaeramoeba flamelloides]|uniref:Uncharacterized protein n=1 Tax=Anaeramoeba flamelloides TaxID=1746091 RepID=A0ABQ8YR65_9EUKA|nr:hypothetical protein M0813_18629 [Anaeramoeba flamelloides]